MRNAVFLKNKNQHYIFIKSTWDFLWVYSERGFIKCDSTDVSV